ncbi:hypothetical protein [Clostridium sp.]|uniref:hypothetical protein n=1 Tax=Clostridium sp. TaxID=1506 RepID=UPI001B6E1788|nr:hypothetical protein [Clostridium sp.]MBP3916610.1 hypothetical protein [Clostridium sp.]
MEGNKENKVIHVNFKRKKKNKLREFLLKLFNTCKEKIIGFFFEDVPDEEDLDEEEY